MELLQAMWAAFVSRSIHRYLLLPSLLGNCRMPNSQKIPFKVWQDLYYNRYTIEFCWSHTSPTYKLSVSYWIRISPTPMGMGQYKKRRAKNEATKIQQRIHAMLTKKKKISLFSVLLWRIVNLDALLALHWTWENENK